MNIVEFFKNVQDAFSAFGGLIIPIVLTTLWVLLSIDAVIMVFRGTRDYITVVTGKQGFASRFAGFLAGAIVLFSGLAPIITIVGWIAGMKFLGKWPDPRRVHKNNVALPQEGSGKMSKRKIVITTLVVSVAAVSFAGCANVAEKTSSTSSGEPSASSSAFLTTATADGALLSQNLSTALSSVSSLGNVSPKDNQSFLKILPTDTENNTGVYTKYSLLVTPTVNPAGTLGYVSSDTSTKNLGIKLSSNTPFVIPNNIMAKDSQISSSGFAANTNRWCVAVTNGSGEPSITNTAVYTWEGLAVGKTSCANAGAAQ